MNEIKHTAEPWWIRKAPDGEDCFITAAKEGRMAYGPEIMGDDYTGYGDAERKQADAHRIVACVNACAGIPDEVLDAPGYSIKDELDSLDAQITGRMKAERERDRFRAQLAALEEVATGVDADIDAGRPLEYNVEHLRDELVRAREALGILPEQDAVRPKGDHAAQYPGQLFDLDEIKKGSPVGQCRCLIHPVPPGLEMLSPEELADGAAVDCQRIVHPVPEEAQKS